jgi:hypothetical protein
VVEASGFKRYVRDGILLQVNDNLQSIGPLGERN